MFVLCCKKTVVDMKERKRTNTEQKWIKGENPGISIKKTHRGHGCLCCVCCKDGSMERDMKDERI
jgi:hypothetical protein